MELEIVPEKLKDTDTTELVDSDGVMVTDADAALRVTATVSVWEWLHVADASKDIDPVSVAVIESDIMVLVSILVAELLRVTTGVADGGLVLDTFIERLIDKVAIELSEDVRVTDLLIEALLDLTTESLLVSLVSFDAVGLSACVGVACNESVIQLRVNEVDEVGDTLHDPTGDAVLVAV